MKTLESLALLVLGMVIVGGLFWVYESMTFDVNDQKIRGIDSVVKTQVKNVISTSIVRKEGHGIDDGT